MEHQMENLVFDILDRCLNELEIVVDNSAKTKIIEYFSLLLTRNESVNLISSKQDLQTQVVVHLVDSLTPLMWSDLPKKAAAMDFGSGGGLPAIPLSLARAYWSYTLVESTGKKVDFLADVKRQMNLDNIETLKTYLEPNKNSDEVFFNIITARGVSDLKKLIPIASPRLEVGGHFIAFKGKQGLNELRDASAIIKRNNFTLAEALEFKLPMVEANRTLLIFERRA